MYFAKKIFKLGGREFQKGDEVPEELLTADLWKWLTVKDALHTEGDAIAFALEEEEDEDGEGAGNGVEASGSTSTGEEEEPGDEDSGTDTEGLPPDEELPDLPDVNGVDAVSEPPKPKPKTAKKGGSKV